MYVVRVAHARYYFIVHAHVICSCYINKNNDIVKVVFIVLPVIGSEKRPIRVNAIRCLRICHLIPTSKSLRRDETQQNYHKYRRFDKETAIFLNMGISTSAKGLSTNTVPNIRNDSRDLPDFLQRECYYETICK